MKWETGDKENLLQQPEDTSISDSWLLNRLTHQRKRVENNRVKIIANLAKLSSKMKIKQVSGKHN